MFNSLFNLNLNPLMDEDGAVGGSPAEGTTLFDGGSSEGDGSPSEPENNEMQDTPEQQERTFTQSELNRIIQDRLTRERQRYTPYESLIANEAKKYGMEPDEYIQAVQRQQQEAEKQRYYEAGLDPDLVSEVVAQHPAVQWAQSFMTQQQQEQMFNAQAKELLEVHPDLDVKNIPPEVFHLNAQGLSLLDAYNRVMIPKIKQDQSKIKEQAVKEYLARKSGRVGVTEGSGSAPVLEMSTPKNFQDAKSQALAYLKSIKE